jgi:pyridoxine kinase
MYALWKAGESKWLFALTLFRRDCCFQFEVEQLTNIKIETMEDTKRACDSLHSMGPSLVFITSMILLGGETMTILASQRVSISQDDDNDNSNHPDSFHTPAWRIDCPVLPFDFTGTGDLCASLLLAHSALQPDNIPAVMEKVINTMFAVLQRTMESAGTTVQSRELKLIQSKDIIEHPPRRFKAEPI